MLDKFFHVTACVGVFCLELLMIHELTPSINPFIAGVAAVALTASIRNGMRSA